MSMWRFTIEGLKAEGQSLSVERLEVQNVAADTPEPTPYELSGNTYQSAESASYDGPTDSEGAEG